MSDIDDLLLRDYDESLPDDFEDREYDACPVCDAELVLRHRRRDGHPFMGCSCWPLCHGTVSVREFVPTPRPKACGYEAHRQSTSHRAEP